MVELQQHTLFSFLDPDMARSLIDEVEVGTYQDGDIIFQEQQLADDICLILNGAVRVTKKDPSGQDQLLAIILENDYFGEYAVIDGLPRSASASASAAMADTILARIPGDQVLKVFQASGQHASLRLLLHTIRKVRENNQTKVEELLRQERNALLGEMAGSIIHDLKNPTSVIAMAASIIQKKGVTPYQDEMCNMINEHVKRIVTMVDEVLDFSRGAPRLNKQPVNMATILGRLETLNRVPLTEAGLQLEIAPLSLTVTVDENKILRVLQNLVGNAAEALARREGKIVVGCKREEGALLITVSDNGPGIPKAMQACLFDPFTTKGKSKGTGLGMAITKSIVETHGGTLNFVTATGQGTTFLIKLPI